jgi:hypothetical protein
MFQAHRYNPEIYRNDLMIHFLHRIQVEILFWFDINFDYLCAAYLTKIMYPPLLTLLLFIPHSLFLFLSFFRWYVSICDDISIYTLFVSFNGLLFLSIFFILFLLSIIVLWNVIYLSSRINATQYIDILFMPNLRGSLPSKIELHHGASDFDETFYRSWAHRSTFTKKISCL